ncbi:MAG: tRNA (adenosine(37)-N6)-threonylcarbamoyltransferase complex transferase subunit TsaD [Clostridia bacterium]|nr:tRNA (adenosine(37)-N6)-threonylcarbamoyltransferase complex transferase subunit TsaD [Clostridia bacterium]
MKILGIESSCDDTAAAVVEDGRVLVSSVVSSQIHEHIRFGGVVPEIASRRHAEHIAEVTRSAMRKAAVDYDDLAGIAVTFAPGLIGSLLVGVNFAKGLSYAADLPLIPVHHLRGHVASNYLSSPGLEPPFLALIVSGGHSHIVMVKDYTSYEIIGRTRDDAAGEALDKAARAMGLDYPGGANLDIAAKDGNALAYHFPRPHVDGAPLDFSFSGLKTSVVNLLHTARQKGESLSVPDVGASYIKAVTDFLIDNTLAACKQTGAEKLAVAGGVSANSVLRRELKRRCAEKRIELFLPALNLCGDNAAMIASQGYYELRAGNIANLSLNALATLGIDRC